MTSIYIDRNSEGVRGSISEIPNFYHAFLSIMTPPNLGNLKNLLEFLKIFPLLLLFFQIQMRIIFVVFLIIFSYFAAHGS